MKCRPGREILPAVVTGGSNRRHEDRVSSWGEYPSSCVPLLVDLIGPMVGVLLGDRAVCVCGGGGGGRRHDVERKMTSQTLLDQDVNVQNDQTKGKLIRASLSKVGLQL